ncbi:MAG: hypothetical protein Q7J25_11450, partial [Vicinamibacterales bacterium]|nr:hypothetical protein [Vicinamibacterales bacterium]
MLESNYLQTAASEPTDASTSQDQSLIEGLFKPMAAALWEYRRTLVAATLVALVLSSSAAAYLYLTSPVRQVAVVPVRFQFEGARNGKYPSLLPFSESDVVSPSVLTTVYERNELSQYMPFSAFSSGLFVLRTSVEAELLTYEYQSKLAEPRLTTVDRTRLEAEFRNKLQSAPTEYALTFVTSPSVNQPPAVLMQKTLDDVLATWAKQAIELRGALTADAELLTAATFSSVPVGEGDLLRRIDVLHGKIRRLIDNIVQLERLLGSRVSRTPKSEVTLPEVRATLEDLLRYEVDPLYTITMSAGLSDQHAAVQYFDSQLRRAQTDAREAEGRRQALFEALRAYADDSSNASTAGGGQAAAP